ncbi:hypothetical protein [Bifidobacterium magnum]|uniref:hypothetical protein n=1 Tax=Bifidobacterium magnum TaxID=1692 RepID=UPI0003B5CB15|nr:hypothetical protein [Bifidobacterium magnum]
MVQDKNTVTLTDTMEYWPYAVRDGVKIRAYDIALIPESVTIHKMNADGSKGEKLDNHKYPMTYETEEIQPNWAPVPYVNNILRFTLPDATPLIIDYTYAVIVMKDEHGKPITDQIQTGAVGGGAVKNKAVLESGSSAEVPWVVGKFQSGATASIDAMFAYKVDSTNYTATIPGARFKLCKWIGDDWTGGELPRGSYDSYAACVPENETGSQLADGQGPLVSTNGGRWVLVNDNVVAGSDGLVVIQEIVAKTQGDVRTFLDANVAYALVETEAPSGYILDPRPHFFHRFTSASPAVHKPTDVESQAMMNNAVMYVPNMSQRSPLRIEKRWFAPAENGGEPIPVDKEDGEISVDIYRSSTTMKAGHRYMEYDVKAVNAYNDAIVHDIESGKMVTNSTVTTTIDGYADWMADKTELKVNGKTVARGAAVNNYEVTLATDTQIEVVVPHSDQHTYAVERDSQPAENAAEVNKDEEKKLYRKGITVSAKNGWTTMVDDLPRFEMSEDGKLITYFYYSIRETGKAALYQVAKSRSYALDPYENNDGIQLGTIYANNWRYATNGDDTGVELPGTGAEGRSVMLTAVALAMLASAFLLLRKIVQ